MSLRYVMSCMLIAGALLASPELSLGRGGGGGGGHGFGGGFHGGGFHGGGFHGGGFGGRGFGFRDRGFRGRGFGFRDRGFRDFDGGFFGFGYPYFYRFIIPIITRILSTGLIWDTKCVRASRLHAESGRMKMGIGFC